MASESFADFGHNLHRLSDGSIRLSTSAYTNPNDPPYSTHAFVPFESRAGSPTSTTGSASALDWNSNSDAELLDMIPQAEHSDSPTALPPQGQGDERHPSTSSTETVMVRRVSLDEIALYHFDSLPSSPSSISSLPSHSAASDAPGVQPDHDHDRSVVVEDDAGGQVSIDSVVEEEEERQEKGKEVARNGEVAPLSLLPTPEWVTSMLKQLDENRRMMSAFTSNTSNEPSGDKANEISVLQMNTSSRTSSPEHHDESEEPSTSMTTVTPSVPGHSRVVDEFACSLFEPPSRPTSHPVSPAHSTLSYISDRPPSPSSHRPLSPLPACHSPPSFRSPSPAASVNTFFSPEQAPIPLDSPGSLTLPPLLPRHIPRSSFSHSPSLRLSTPLIDSFGSPSLLTPPLQQGSPKSVVSGASIPSPPSQSSLLQDHRGAETTYWPSTLRRSRSYKASFERATQAATLRSGFSDNKQDSFTHPGMITTMPNIPMWLKASTKADRPSMSSDLEDGDGIGHSNNPSNTSAPVETSNTNAAIRQPQPTRQRPPLPPLPSSRSQVFRAPEHALTSHSRPTPMSLWLSTSISNQERPRSTESLRSIPLLSPPSAYGHVLHGLDMQDAERLPSKQFGYFSARNPTPPVLFDGSPRIDPSMPLLSPTSPSPPASPVPAPRPRNSIYEGPVAPSLPSQRRLRFAPLPPTPGSSLRASVFNSPYSTASAAYPYSQFNHPLPMSRMDIPSREPMQTARLPPVGSWYSDALANSTLEESLGDLYPAFTAQSVVPPPAPTSSFADSMNAGAGISARSLGAGRPIPPSCVPPRVNPEPLHPLPPWDMRVGAGSNLPSYNMPPGRPSYVPAQPPPYASGQPAPGLLPHNPRPSAQRSTAPFTSTAGSGTMPMAASTTSNRYSRPIHYPTAASIPCRPPTIRSTPHPVFWFADGTVDFEIEDMVFKVHRHFFEKHSDHFRILFGTRPASMGSPILSLPFDLPGVKKADFERLLYVFYPSSLINPDLTTAEDWTSVLTLAMKWNMSELKWLSIQKLTTLASAVDKISLVKKFDLHTVSALVDIKADWLIPAYTELCSRNAPLSEEEAEKLDMKTVVKVWEVQHEILNWPGAYYGPQILALVKEKFKLD